MRFAQSVRISTARSDISKLTEVQEEEPEKEEVVEYSPDPGVRLVRIIWTRGNVEERVKNYLYHMPPLNI
jgi:hypothetical protein